MRILLITSVDGIVHCRQQVEPTWRPRDSGYVVTKYMERVSYLPVEVELFRPNIERVFAISTLVVLRLCPQDRVSY